MAGSSIEATLELWASSLREVKSRIGVLFTQERVAASAGLFLDGLLGEERRKTGWIARPRRRAIPVPGGIRPFWGGSVGMRTICATSCVTMRLRRWAMTTRCL